MKSCSVEGCKRKYDCNGYCHTHYYRLLRTGSVEDKPLKFGVKWSGNKREYHRIAQRIKCRLEPEKVHAYDKIRTQRYKFKRSVQNKVFQAIKYGRLEKTDCVVCGSFPSEGHHEDYHKALDVIWVCRPHHDLIHA